MRLILFFTTYNVHLVYILQECMEYGMSISKSVNIKKSVMPNLFCVTGQRLCHRVRVAPICVNELGHYLFIKCYVSFSVSYFYLIKIQQLSCKRMISKIPSAKWRLFLSRPQCESTRLCPSNGNGSLFFEKCIFARRWPHIWGGEWWDLILYKTISIIKNYATYIHSGEAI